MISIFCKHCQAETEHYERRTRSGGICAPCARERARLRRINSPDIVRKENARYVSNNREKVRAKARNSARRRHAENPEKYREKAKISKRKHWASILLSAARARCRAEGWPIPTITVAWILERFETNGRKCPVLGIPLQIRIGSREEDQPSLDRRDNALFYDCDNVEVVSWRWNRIRGAMSFDDMRAGVDYFRRAEPKPEESIIARIRRQRRAA